MKKLRVVLLCILAVILLAAGCFAYMQRNTIGALIDSFRYSKEDVEKKLAENNKELQKIIDEDENISVRDLTEEEKKAVADGEITEDDVVQIITGQTTLEDVKKENQTSGETNKGETGTPKADEPAKTEPSANTNENKGTQSSADDKTLSELIAKLYVKKNQSLSELDSIDIQMRREYWAIPKEERDARRREVVSKYMKILGDWERECDSTVYGILDEIKAELTKTGKDDSIVKKIEDSYLNEKKLKKAAYMNEYTSKYN